MVQLPADFMAPIISTFVLKFALSCLCLSALGSAAAKEMPAKLVSFNLCADQLVLEFGNFEQVLGLSSMSRNPELSFHWRLAASIPAIRASAESALRLAPELVLVGLHDAKYTTAVLAKSGMKIHSMAAWKTLAETRTGASVVAAAMGQTERGMELVWDIDRSLRQLEELRPALRRSPSFLIIQRRGYAQKEGVTAEVLIHAGMRDASDEFSLPAAGGFVPLEQLVKARPEYLVVSDAIALAEDQGRAFLLHPAVMRLYPAMKRLIIPDVLSICPGPATPALISQVRREIEAKVILK